MAAAEDQQGLHAFGAVAGNKSPTLSTLPRFASPVCTTGSQQDVRAVPQVCSAAEQIAANDTQERGTSVAFSNESPAMVTNCFLAAGLNEQQHMALREAALLEYDITGDFAAKGLADRHLQLARARRGMAETSIEAFHSLPVAAYLQPKEQAVMALFTGQDVAYTREQIAALLRWKEAAVCGRANSLVTKGQLEEIEGGKTASGRSAKLLRLPRPGRQATLLEIR